jgi:hypothetical protein
MLYALTAQHPARERFRELVARSEDPEALSEAHQILLHSGAISYCTFKMIEFSQEAQTILDGTLLHDAGPVLKVLRLNVKPLYSLLETVGVEEPELITV